ncbi:MAG TPA: glucose-6-phosphate dehydrogenase [Caulobacteraceae bacterium]|jgi:glucose-6-phosphate 1-dehydrogenase|nr:glucose-6-phosphate dehydrogenase [Caulobacteraceae bacterium]
MTDRAIVIFGATGDLSLRMLLPSLYFLEADGLLPADLAVVGAARTELSEDAFTERAEAAARGRAGARWDAQAWARLRARLGYVRVEADAPESFHALHQRLSGVREIVFYLSTSPSLYADICAGLLAAGLAGPENRVVVEKPIGHDLESCRRINDALATAFSEDRIFRIDHYLGKEAVQNLIALRFANTLFEPLWNKVSIDHVQITVAEEVGVEGRWGYYEEHGALRDMVQNHVLQLLCLIAMEPPASLDPDSVRNEKVKVLRSLRPIAGRELERRTVRGQYVRGVAAGAQVPGYAEEAGGHPAQAETYVALCAHVNNWRWAGVPFYLRTGKRMPAKTSQIVVQFREVPYSIFGGADLLANRLTIRLQPEEEISLSLMNKAPDAGAGAMTLKPLSLNLSLTEAFPQERRRRIAYERLLLEVLNHNPTLFVRRDEVEAAWSWIDSIEAGWRAHDIKPAPYPAGSWGPAGSFALTERNGHSWYD